MPGFVAAAVVLVIIGVFFLLPVFPYTQTTSAVFGAYAQSQSAHVSLSFIVLRCGLVYAMTNSSSVFGQNAQSSSSGSAKWLC